MPLFYEVESLDSVPEAHRAEYAPTDDGKFRLSVNGLPDVSKLKVALDKERAIFKDIKKLGNIADIEAALAKAREPQPFEPLLEQHRQLWAIEKTRLEKELATSRASEHRTIRETVITVALKEARALPEGMDLLVERVGERVALETAPNGTRRLALLAADRKTPMPGATIGSLIAETRGAFPSLFLGTGVGGSGTNQRSIRSAPIRTLTRAQHDALSPAERMQKIRVEGYRLVD